MSEIPARLIGPIPTSYTSPVDDGVFAHPGGPAPRWGNYAPILVQVPLSWLSVEVQALVTQPGTCWGAEERSLRGAIYRAHTTDTLLILAADGWYVAAPARPCRRAVTIAVEALRDGAEVPAGLLQEEASEAQRIYAEGGATHRARLPWEPKPEPWPAPWPAPSSEPVEIFRRTPDED